MQRRDDPGSVYVCPSDFARVHSFEAWGGERLVHLLQSPIAGLYILCIAVHFDAVATGDRSQYPWSVSVVNFPFAFRKGEHGSAKFAFSGKTNIRKLRGSAHHERLDPARGPFAVSGLDMLHGLRTGVVGEKLQKVLDCVFLNEYIRTDTIRSTEDVRELVDLRLSCMGNWYGHAAFSHGFYGRGDGGGLRGVEATSLARLIPFAIAGCPILIPDAQKRRQVLSAAWSLLTLVSEFKTEQY